MGYDPSDASSWDIQRFCKDWAGAEFLDSLRVVPEVGPRFFGGDRDLGFFVIEDLGPHRSLVEPLLEGTAETANAALATFAATLGRMHAATIGQRERYRTVCRGLNTNVACFESAPSDFGEYAGKIEAILTRVGITADAGLTAELKVLHDEMEAPGPFHAYIHGDPCPDNVFFIDNQIRLIDFEFGHYGHALRDALYGRMPFPTCWCCNRLPAETISTMESMYRAELVKGCPEAADDALFHTSLVRVCAHWTLGTLLWHIEDTLKSEGKWGIADVRPRVLTRLDTFIELSETHGQLPTLRITMNRLRDALSRQWLEADRLPLYPAFRQVPPAEQK